MKKILSVCLLFATTFAWAQESNEVAAKYAELITQKGLKEKLTIIASAEMEGRETATPGQKRAAAYIEDEFKKFGLLPGNGDSYQLKYPVFQDELISKKLQVNGKTFEWDKDYSFGLTGINNGDWTFNNLVFAGYGIVDSANKINDYTGLNVSGKIVLVMDGSGAPAPAAPATPQRGRGGFGGPTSAAGKAAAAQKAGAAGIIIIASNFPRTTATPVKGNMYLPRPNAPFMTVTVSNEVGSALLGRPATLTTAQLKEVNKGSYSAELKLNVEKSVVNLESSDVVGILPGTDKKDEYVFLTGHYDHLGKRGDVIYYGADDDGSGTVSVLQMAEAFSAAAKKGIHPRRTIVFMTVSGEEKGLWGSQYYSEHPIFPLDKTSVDLNTDMVGRIDTERKTGDTMNYVYVIGHDKLSSELPIINEGVNNKNTKLVLDYKYDDPNDQNRIYFRSDHYNFARMGIPILFFYDGMLQADYHKPTDTIEKITWPLYQKRVQLIFLTGWDMANRDKMLKRDTPLNMPSR